MEKDNKRAEWALGRFTMAVFHRGMHFVFSPLFGVQSPSKPLTWEEIVVLQLSI
jgi:hypothetical protein